MFNTENIKKIRANLGYSQSNMAELMHVSRTSYAMWESNNDIFPIKRLINFCEITNSSLDYALGLTNEKINITPSYNKEKIKVRLKALRKENNLIQDDLAQLLNTTKAVISGYEVGRYLIATPFLYTICKKYHISADYLLGRTDEPKYLNNN